ncbi:hypothetical protein PU630_16025 [Microbacterium horticulturae]|uniref:SbsA Ig-like domain-containing protein n=1 Tax=Microbacterium horticulturae TaxID=3028316 RepID=A0ABY8BX44_9MICO|nr:hypothetical protein [Microbacterium sp. KACC 23027]WEG08729.1 hypothetical protein PU630_16025 [Microbacterium sp. KACC 23027]
MSTESGLHEPATRRAASRRRRSRAFLGGFAAVIGVLAVLGLAGAAVGSAQGPRATAVQVDPDAAATASGARLIVTMNQSLHTITAGQVTVEPAAEFTVDTAGRTMGVRFTLPLHDATDYTVTFHDVAGLGGGRTTTVTETFTTSHADMYLLQRGSAEDRIVRTRLDGSDPQAVLRADHIEDFRATSSHLVAATLDAHGKTALVVTDLDGRHRRQLPLPGNGTVTRLQSADRGELIGYTYSDANLGDEGARESRLYTASLKDSAADTKPAAVTVSGDDPRVADWRFVPDSDSILVLSYDGRMLLAGPSGDDAADLGTGNVIDGIARGSSVAYVERADGMVTVDLTDGTIAPLVNSTRDGSKVPGHRGVVTPLPGQAGGSVQPYTVLDVAGGSGADSGAPEGTTIYRVAADGTATPVFEMPVDDAIQQTCVSPSGQYAAITVAPDSVHNDYDDYLLPMPQKVVTHIVSLDDGTEVHTVSGFDASWCQVPPTLAQ